MVEPGAASAQSAASAAICARKSCSWCWRCSAESGAGRAPGGEVSGEASGECASGAASGGSGGGTGAAVRLGAIYRCVR